MTEEQKRRFEEKEGYTPTEENFQYFVNKFKKYGYIPGIQAYRIDKIKQLKYSLNGDFVNKKWSSWVSTIYPYLEEFAALDKSENELREICGVEKKHDWRKDLIRICGKKRLRKLEDDFEKICGMKLFEDKDDEVFRQILKM